MTTFLFLLAIFAAAAVLLPLRLESGSPLQVEYQAGVMDAPGNNFAAASIPDGSLVSWDVSQTGANAAETSVKRGVGVAVPVSANARYIAGIAQANDSKVTKTNESCRVVVGGPALALVYIPANCNLLAGTELTLRTGWDITNHGVTYGDATTLSGTPTVGHLAPVFVNAALRTLANPIAVVRQAYNNATGSAVVKKLWVWVLPHHRPQAFTWEYVRSGIVIVTAADFLLGRPACGPGMVDDYALQLLDCGSGGDVTLQVEVSPLGTTADQLSIFTTAPVVDDDGSNGVVIGPLVSLIGDTDTNVAPGTTGVNGTLKSAALCSFPGHSIVTGTLTYGGGAAAQTDLRLLVSGVYF